MQRNPSNPRPNWERIVEKQGLLFHTAERTVYEDGAFDSYRTVGTAKSVTEKITYWNESAYYEFTMEEILSIERDTEELHRMCLAAAEHVIEKNRFAELGIPERAIPLIRQTWEDEPPSLYGRFDLAYDGLHPPKMLEYNADTPTSLLEAAVIQWNWLQDVFPKEDQFNSIHEKLIAKWKDIKAHVKGPVHFGYLEDIEDEMTIGYLRDTAEQAGIKTKAIPMAQIGYVARPKHFGDAFGFVDADDRHIANIFKLYPWEWMAHEEFFKHLIDEGNAYQTFWIEPIWKMILSNKGLLPILWELFPGHKNLLPAYFDGPRQMTSYVKKPKMSREGANVQIVDEGRVLESQGGDYGEEGFVYQEYWPLPGFDGNRPVLGSWMIDQEPAGMGIRESDGIITGNTSRFVPHVIIG